MITIREQINKLIEAQLATITQPLGYATDVGARVIRGRNDVMPDELPCVLMFPSDEVSERGSSFTEHEMDLNIVAMHRFKSHNPSIECEKLLGDLITCLTAVRLDLQFYAGYRQPALGQILTGSNSGASGLLESITVSTGTWNKHNVSGIFRIRLPLLDFAIDYLLNPGGETVATTNGVYTLVEPFNNLVNDINYRSAIVDSYPQPGEDVVKVSASFSVVYSTLTGNPYNQGV